MIHPGSGEQNADVPTVNRCALVLEPASGYLEWTRICPDPDPNLTLAELCQEGTVYLIPEVDAGPDAWLRRNYKAIFENELNGWCTDDSLWPEDRSFKVFQEFFNIKFCSIVLDMGKGAIALDNEL